MSDDYQYRSRSVPKVDQEPLGFGRVLPFGFNSFVPSNGESGSPEGASGRPTGAPGGGGGGDGGTTPGSGGSLPAGTEGAFLRYNGSAWVAIAPSLTKGILTNNAASHQWISGVVQGDMIYYDGDKWVRIEAPQSGTHVLGVIDGEIQYIETESCDT
jgi:hypothetical protein